MNKERENPTLRAFRELSRNPNAGIADLPSTRLIEAGDTDAIRKAGKESKKIRALIEAYQEPLKIKGYLKRILIKYF